jgi:hypothetical protein
MGSAGAKGDTGLTGATGPQGPEGKPGSIEGYAEQKICVEDVEDEKKTFAMHWGDCEKLGLRGVTYSMLVKIYG